MEEFRHLGFPLEALHLNEAAFRRLPESSRRLFAIIAREQKATPKELVAWSGLSPRTVRFGLARLREDSWIDVVRSLRDGRTCYYFVHPERVDKEALTAARARASHEVAEDGGFLVQRTERPVGAFTPGR